MGLVVGPTGQRCPGRSASRLWRASSGACDHPCGNPRVQRRCTCRSGPRSWAPCRSAGSWPGSRRCAWQPMHMAFFFSPALASPLMSSAGLGQEWLRAGQRPEGLTGNCLDVLHRLRRCRSSGSRIIGRALYWPGHPTLRTLVPVPMKFEGTERYVATPDLMLAVNAAMHAASARCWSRASRAPARRCWPRRCAGAGHAAAAVAHQEHHQGAAGLYEYDAVSRLRDSQLGDERGQGHPQLHRQGRAVAGLHAESRWRC
jgi:hypothetical protein